MVRHFAVLKRRSGPRWVVRDTRRGPETRSRRDLAVGAPHPKKDTDELGEAGVAQVPRMKSSLVKLAAPEVSSVSKDGSLI